MDVRQLLYFVTVAEAGSFTRASKTLRIAQPALGQQVRKLEEEYRLKLLVRHSRGIEVTPEGQMLLERARKIIEQFEETKTWLRELGHGPQEIVLGISQSAAGILAQSLLERLHKQNPRLKLTLVEATSINLAEWIEDGRLGMALAHNARDSLRFESLVRQPLYFITHSETGGESSRSIPLACLEGQRLVMPGAGHSIRNVVDDAARKARVQLEIVHDIQSIRAICDLVQTGKVATVMPLGSIRNLVAEGKLTARRIVAPEVSSTLGLVSAAQRSLTPSQMVVRNILRALIRSQLDKKPGFWLPLRSATEADCPLPVRKKAETL